MYLEKEGYIEFLGRKDGQIKINGYRVEIGEIERAIEQLEYVEGCAVVCKNVSGQNKVCAFLKNKLSYNIKVEKVKEDLRNLLPSYMVPAFIRIVKDFPLNSNGKINRAVLPDISQEKDNTNYKEKATNKLESFICSIVEELIGVTDIGINENLFEIGLDSVHAIKLISRLNKQNMIINLKTVYEQQCIKNIASALSQYESGITSEEQYVMCLHKEQNAKKNIFCFPPVASVGIVYKKFAEIIGKYNVYSFDFIPDYQRLELYTNLIKKIQSSGEYLFLGISAGGNLAFELAKKFEKEGEKIDKLILLDSFYIDEMNVNIMPEETSKNYAVEAAGIMMEQYPELCMEESYKKKLANNIQAYYGYLDTLVNTGVVNAPIYVLKSPTSSNEHIRGDIEGWKNCTHSIFDIYTGFGNHAEMLNEEYVEKNVKIIEGIL